MPAADNHAAQRISVAEQLVGFAQSATAQKRFDACGTIGIPFRIASGSSALNGNAVPRAKRFRFGRRTVMRCVTKRVVVSQQHMVCVEHIHHHLLYKVIRVQLR